jgi:hypothetical protein
VDPGAPVMFLSGNPSLGPLVTTTYARPMTQWGLDTLFNPAKRHMDDEKQRLQSTREEVGDNSGGRRVDLESGKVVIRRSENEDGAQNEGAATESAVSAPAEAVAKTDAKADGKAAKKSEPSAAAQRAAARRGRTAR